MSPRRGPRRASRRRRAPPRFRGLSYGGWTIRDIAPEFAPPRRVRTNRPRVRLTPTVWGVRVDIHPLGIDGVVHGSPPPPRAPLALVEGLRGMRELTVQPLDDGWDLIRDGVEIGVVSRPANVAMVRVVAPPSRRPAPGPRAVPIGPGAARLGT